MLIYRKPLKSPVYIKANPKSEKGTIPNTSVRVFLNRMFTVFFDCVKPASTLAKPKCIINTNAVANIIQMLLVVNRTLVIDCASVAASWVTDNIENTDPTLKKPGK